MFSDEKFIKFCLHHPARAPCPRLAMTSRFRSTFRLVIWSLSKRSDSLIFAVSDTFRIEGGGIVNGDLYDIATAMDEDAFAHPIK
jgi:hypothetical protein